MLRFDPSLVIAELEPGRVLKVKAPAGYNWHAAGKAVLQDVSKWIHAYREDDPVFNLAEVARQDALLLAAFRQPEAGKKKPADPEKIWRAALTEDSRVAATGSMLRTIRALDGRRQHAWDPRLDEVVRIAAALESLWRQRLGDEHLEAWLGGGAEPAPADLKERVTGLVGKRRARSAGLNTLASTRATDVAGRIAWGRVAACCRLVAPHVGKLAAADARAEDARALQQLAGTLRGLRGAAEVLAGENR